MPARRGQFWSGRIRSTCCASHQGGRHRSTNCKCVMAKYEEGRCCVRCRCVPLDRQAWRFLRQCGRFCAFMRKKFPCEPSGVSGGAATTGRGGRRCGWACKWRAGSPSGRPSGKHLVFLICLPDPRAALQAQHVPNQRPHLRLVPVPFAATVGRTPYERIR